MCVWCVAIRVFCVQSHSVFVLSLGFTSSKTNKISKFACEQIFQCEKRDWKCILLFGRQKSFDKYGVICVCNYSICVAVYNLGAISSSSSFWCQLTYLPEAQLRVANILLKLGCIVKAMMNDGNGSTHIIIRYRRNLKNEEKRNLPR